MTTRSHPWRLALALCAAACFLFACEVTIGGKKLDPKKAEKMVKDQLEKLGAVISKVTCPPDIAPKKDATFICNVTAENGDVLEVEFTQDDSKGNVTITRSDAVIVAKVLIPQITEQLKKNPATAKVEVEKTTCPPDHKAKKDHTFECIVTTKAQTALIIAVKETDAKGSVDFRLHGINGDPKKLSAELQSSLANKNKIRATVDCGTNPVRLVPGTTAECAATDDKGKQAKIQLVPTNPLGAFDWRIVASGAKQ